MPRLTNEVHPSHRHSLRLRLTMSRWTEGFAGSWTSELPDVMCRMRNRGRNPPLTQVMSARPL